MTGQRHYESNLRERPVLAQQLIERLGGLLGGVVAQKGGHLQGEGPLLFRQRILDAISQRIGDPLVEERLLAFQEELLVAQRADSQPSQHQAGTNTASTKTSATFFMRTR